MIGNHENLYIYRCHYANANINGIHITYEMSVFAPSGYRKVIRCTLSY